MKRFTVAAVMLLFFGSSAAYAIAEESSSINQRNRLDVSAGYYMPSGDYKAPGAEALPFNSGWNAGAGYTRWFFQNFGLGLFLDYVTFASEEKYMGYDVSKKADVSSLIFGAQAQFQVFAGADLSFFGAAKAGMASNTLKLTKKTTTTNWAGVITTDTEENSDSISAMALILEGGFRYGISDNWDIGALLKYSIIKAKAKDGHDEVDTDFGGIAIAAQVGFRF